jgi:hypothetical protein
VKTLKHWLIGTSLFLAGATTVMPAQADENDLAAAMASLKSSLAAQALLQPPVPEIVAKPQEVCALVQTIIEDADAHRLSLERSAIENVFVEHAVDRLHVGWFPSEYLTIGSAAMLDMSAYDNSWPRQDQAARFQIKLMGDWWAGDFGARHGGFAGGGGPELSIGVSGTHREAPVDPRWIEDDTKFTFDALLKIDRLSLYGAVIDKEAETPFAGRTTDNQGAMVQVGYFLIPNKLEPFLRYEWPGLDASDAEFAVATVGVNYYLKPHTARFTLSVAWTDAGRKGMESNNDFDRGGLMRDGSRDAVSVRAQLQLLF